MNKAEKIAAFDPNGPGLQNGHFIGLPFSEEDAEVVLLPVPWEVTVSSFAGTASGPQNILEASYQLDLHDPYIPDAWKLGIYMRDPNPSWMRQNEKIRPTAFTYIQQLEAGTSPADNQPMRDSLAVINEACRRLHQEVERECSEILNRGQVVGIVGGEHSVPLGLMRALASRNDSFGILQIDAHMDLRHAYEGFHWSHASIFYNALDIPQLSSLTQVGIRDFCEAEIAVVKEADGRIKLFTDHAMRHRLYSGETYASIVQEIVATLPLDVYISFDIDGLDPSLCPHTGTPVPGGLSFHEAVYLIWAVVQSGRRILGFDLSEVAGVGHAWDGNVGARILYHLSNMAGYSRGRYAYR